MGALCTLLTTGQTTSQGLDTLEELVGSFRSAQPSEAVRHFATWPPLRIETETRAFLNRTADAWAVAALAGLHTETGLAKRTFGDVLRDVPMLTGAISQHEIHYRSAHSIVERLIQMAKERQDEALLRFCASWCIVAASWMPHEHMGARWSHVMDLARALDDDPDIRLLLGSESEYWTGPEIVPPAGYYGRAIGPSHGPVNVVSTRFGNLDGFAAATAEEYFRSALRSRPELMEARLRLGRVLYLLGRTREARSELQRSLRDAEKANERFSGYVSGLLLGRLLDDAQEIDEAIAVNRRAIAMYPDGVAARVALGQALFVAGQPADAWMTTRLVFGTAGAPRRSAGDPWGMYFARQYWQQPARLRFMRDLVRIGTDPRRVQFDPGTLDAFVLDERPRGVVPPDRVGLSGPVFHSGVEAVRVEVLVTDDGRPVAGLTAGDFVVQDGGRTQLVTKAVTADEVTAALLVDTSESISGPSWGGVMGAADAAISALQTKDVLSVVTFSDRLELLVARSNDREALRRAVAAVRPAPHRKTMLWDAVFAAASLVADGPGRPVVMVVSDGGDNASWFERDRAFLRLGRLGVSVDPIELPRHGPGSRFDLAFGSTDLRPLAEATGGRFFNASESSLAQRVWDRFIELRASYILSYTPTPDVRRRTGWHEIRVRLKPGHRGTVQARPGYYAPWR